MYCQLNEKINTLITLQQTVNINCLIKKNKNIKYLINKGLGNWKITFPLVDMLV